METWSIHTSRNTGKIETVDYLGDGMETYEINRPSVRHWVAHAIKLEDAILIAAAPELLAALTAHIEVSNREWAGYEVVPDWLTRERELVAKIHAALAKARPA